MLLGVRGAIALDMVVVASSCGDELLLLHSCWVSMFIILEVVNN